MQFRNVTQAQLDEALAQANEKYEENLRFHEVHKRGAAIQLTLRTIRGGVLGSRTSHSGRKINAASWEAHRDFLWALFDLNPDANVKSHVAHYRNREEFLRLFPDTGHQNIGSMMCPMTMREATFYP